MGEPHHHNGRLEGAANNVWALIIARFILPVAVVLSGVIGTYFLNSLTHSNESIWTKLSELQSSIAAMHETIAVMDNRILSQTEVNEQKADEVEHRLRELEARRR